MRKKLLSLTLALAMIFSCTQAFAVRRENAGSGPSKANNILASFGSFNKAEDARNSMIKTSNTTVSYHDTGATSSGGSLKVNVNAAWGYMYISVPYVEGETYDISFYARIDDAASAGLEFIPMLDVGGWDHTILQGTFTEQWQKFTCSYVCDGLNYQNENGVGAIRLFNTRRGAGNFQTSYYLDELVVSPRGNGSYDWETWKKNNGVEGNAKDVIPADTGFATPQPESNVQFTDTNGHWAEETVEMLAASNYIQGMGDGTFHPQDNVTRAQFITMAMNLMRLDSAGYKGMYSDVAATDWFVNDVQNAYDIGVIDPIMTVGGKFLPNQPITRQEAASIISRLSKLKELTEKKEVSAFADNGDIAAWTRDAVNDAVKYGIINGYPDGTFRPANTITRAESAAMIFRFIENTSRFAVYVDANVGNDKNEGTKEAPLKTINAARKMVQPYLKTMRNHIYVYINDGRYVLNDSVDFGLEDSGNNGYYVIYRGVGENKPVVSAGKDYSGFELYDAEKDIYRTYVGVGTLTRQVYINGVRGVRARNEINIDCCLTNATVDSANAFYLCDDVELASFERQSDMEMVYFCQWRDPRVHIQSISKTEDGRCKVQMVPESWRACTNTNTPADWPCYLENAYELLDAKGEWYMNREDGYLYYKPRDYEDPATMVASVPVGERLFTVAGNSADEKIHNLKFDNISMEYVTWLYPSTQKAGYLEGQGGHSDSGYAGDGRLTGGKEDAAMIVADAAYIDVTNCKFSKLGAAGLNFRQIFQNCNIIGNEFGDLSGGGINLGCANTEGEFTKWVKPTDYKNFKTGINVLNNYFHDVSIDYMNTVPINISFIKNTKVQHNEITNCNYSGMHIGWGWGGYANTGTGTVNLDIMYNYIHETGGSYIYDGGGIYNVGATGGSADNYNQMSENYFENMRNAYGALYPDEGTTYFEIARNVIDYREVPVWNRRGALMEPTWLHLWTTSIVNNYVHDNYSTTANARMDSANNKYEKAHVYEDGEWPTEAQAIKDNAGLEPEYLEIFPDSIQRLRIKDKLDMYFIKTGETVKLDVVGYKRKLQEVQIPYSELNFYSTNEKVAAVSADGVISCVGEGRCAIYVEYLDDDIIRRQYVDVVCNDIASKIVSNATSFNVLQDYEVTIDVIAQTRFGNEKPVDTMDFVVDDPSVVSVDANGTIKGLAKGATTIHATYTADGTELKVDYAVSVISYVTEDSVKHEETSTKMLAGNNFFNPGSWTTGAQKLNEGDGVAIAASRVSYFNSKMGNQLISFDLTINNPNSWPSVALRSQNVVQDFNSTDTYMMGFKPSLIEVQRFNNGKRTMIFGSQEYNPVGGPGYPNELPTGGQLFEYGKRYSVTMGALDEEGGTRLVLIINGKPIFDYLDNAEGYIKEGGYFGIYAYQGNFELRPFTAQKFEGLE